MNEPLTLRSYRLAFQLERRLHRIDRFRIPVPYGVPLRGLAYAAIALIAVLWLRAIPVIGMVVSLIPWPVRFLVVPIVTAVLLCRLDYDGRPAHEAAVAWIGAMLAPTTVVAFGGARRASAATLDDVVVAPDERSPALRRGRIGGAGNVTFRIPVEARRRGRDLEIKPGPNRPLLVAPAIELDDRGRLLVG